MCCTPVICTSEYMTMRNIQFAILCLLCAAHSYSQPTDSYGRVDVEITKEKRPKKVYAKAEITSPFIGGDSSWLQSFERNLNQSLTIDRRVKKGKYIVSVAFVVLKDSNLAEIRCVKDPGFGMGEAVTRVLKKGMVRWKPGGYPVSPYRRSAVTHPDSN